MHTSGEKPGKGTYKCQKCGKEITLDDNSELPICLVCGHDKWDKIAYRLFKRHQIEIGGSLLPGPPGVRKSTFSTLLSDIW